MPAYTHSCTASHMTFSSRCTAVVTVTFWDVLNTAAVWVILHICLATFRTPGTSRPHVSSRGGTFPSGSRYVYTPLAQLLVLGLVASPRGWTTPRPHHTAPTPHALPLAFLRTIWTFRTPCIYSAGHARITVRLTWTQFQDICLDAMDKRFLSRLRRVSSLRRCAAPRRPVARARSLCIVLLPFAVHGLATLTAPIVSLRDSRYWTAFRYLLPRPPPLLHHYIRDTLWVCTRTLRSFGYSFPLTTRSNTAFHFVIALPLRAETRHPVPAHTHPFPRVAAHVVAFGYARGRSRLCR